jgi:HTH-type transcriptional regulator/antitoxin HigA
MTEHTRNQYKPIWISHPGETLKDFLDERGISQAELAERTGRPKKTINEIIKGKAPITPETAIQFERVLRVPASFWNSRQRMYDECKARKTADEKLNAQIGWLDAFNMREIISAGWINPYRDKLAQLNELLKFFGVNSPAQWESIWQSPQAIYRQSPAFRTDPKAISVWLRKGEIEAEKIYCVPFNQSAFRTTLKELRKLTQENFDEFNTKIVKTCAAIGVAVVFIRRLKGIPVYGVTRWLSPQKALIQLSLRGKFEDIFWFTFFHEAGHILLHGKREVFLEIDGAKGPREQDADKFAQSVLISKAEWQRFIKRKYYKSREEIISFAQELSISPAIIIGRLQHEGLIPKNHQLNMLRRRYDLTE